MINGLSRPTSLSCAVAHLTVCSVVSDYNIITYLPSLDFSFGFGNYMKMRVFVSTVFDKIKNYISPQKGSLSLSPVWPCPSVSGEVPRDVFWVSRLHYRSLYYFNIIIIFTAAAHNNNIITRRYYCCYYRFYYLRGTAGRWPVGSVT